MMDGDFVLKCLLKCEWNDSHVFVVNLKLNELHAGGKVLFSEIILSFYHKLDKHPLNPQHNY